METTQKEFGWKVKFNLFRDRLCIVSVPGLYTLPLHEQAFLSRLQSLAVETSKSGLEWVDIRPSRRLPRQYSMIRIDKVR